MSEVKYVRDAETQYNDWTGTAAAEPAQDDHPYDLYRVLRLDRGRWRIVGIDLYVEQGARLIVYLTSSDRATTSSEDVEVHARSFQIAVQGGDDGIPVTDVLSGFDRLNVVLTGYAVDTMRIIDESDADDDMT